MSPWAGDWPPNNAKKWPELAPGSQISSYTHAVEIPYRTLGDRPPVQPEPAPPPPPDEEAGGMTARVVQPGVAPSLTPRWVVSLVYAVIVVLTAVLFLAQSSR